jgi:phospholipid/cholesterol/gamma-HCH transport system permease protein
VIADGARLVWGYSAMVAHVVAHRGLLGQREVREALWRQVHFTGVRALPYVAGVAALFGAVFVTRAMNLLGDDNEAAFKAIINGGLGELGPLLTAFIVIVRSSVAIAAEVALMRLRADMNAALWKDVTQEDEIVLPRVLGGAVGAALLVVCFEFIALASAIIATAFTLGTSVVAELDDFLLAADVWQVPLSLAKGALFGAGIAAISCYHGLQVERDAGEVPKAVVSACVGSLTFVLAVDAAALMAQWLF